MIRQIFSIEAQNSQIFLHSLGQDQSEFSVDSNSNKFHKKLYEINRGILKYSYVTLKSSNPAFRASSSAEIPACIYIKNYNINKSVS